MTCKVTLILHFPDSVLNMRCQLWWFFMLLVLVRHMAEPK